jgi:hypothetical protein
MAENGRLAGRLAKLEGLFVEARSGRCPVCADWRECRVEWEPDIGHPFPEPSGQRPNPPEVCPACGWRPRLVKIGWAEHWPPWSAEG